MTPTVEIRTVALGHIDVVIRDLDTDKELDHGLFATWDESGAEEFAERRVTKFGRELQS